MADRTTASVSAESLSLCIDDWLVEFSRLVKDTRLVVKRDSCRPEEISCSFNLSYDEVTDSITITSEIDSHPGSRSSVSVSSAAFASILEKSMVNGDFLFNVPEMQTFFSNQISELVQKNLPQEVFILSDVVLNSNILILRNETLVAAAAEQRDCKVPLITIGTFTDGNSAPEHSAYLNYHAPERVYFPGQTLFGSLTGLPDESCDERADSDITSEDRFRLIFFPADAENVIIIEAELAGSRLKIKSVSVAADFLDMKSAVAAGYNDLGGLVNAYADRLEKTRSENWLGFLD